MITINQVGDNTADVTIDGETRTLPARIDADAIRVTGIAVRFKTGSKVWNAGLTKWLASGNISRPHIVNMDFRFNDNVTVIGFYSDYANQSQHNGQKTGR